MDAKRFLVQYWFQFDKFKERTREELIDMAYIKRNEIVSTFFDLEDEEIQKFIVYYRLNVYCKNLENLTRDIDNDVYHNVYKIIMKMNRIEFY